MGATHAPAQLFLGEAWQRYRLRRSSCHFEMNAELASSEFNASTFLADVILVLHAMVVLFNVGDLHVIWVGHFRGRAFVRNFYFRMIHLLLIGIVAVESVFGIICPLTNWEDALRASNGTGTQHQNGFIADWLHELLFYDLPAWVFTVAYLLFFGLVVLTFYWVRPRVPRFHGGS